MRYFLDRSTRRLPSVLVPLTVALALVLAACGTGEQGSTTAPQSQESTTTASQSQTSTTEAEGPALSGSINVQVVASPSSDALREMAKSFTAETGVEVNFFDIPWEEVTSSLLLGRRAGSTGFDVVQFDLVHMAELVEGEVVAPLDDLIAASPNYEIDDFHPRLQEYNQYNGTTYALSLSTEPIFLYYRKDLYEELGLEPPQTIDEYLSNAQALKDAGYFGASSGFSPQFGGWYWMQHAYQFGADVIDPSSCEILVTDPDFVAATESYLSLIPYIPESMVAGSGGAAFSSFVELDVGQMILYSGYYPLMEDPAESKLAGTGNIATAPAPLTSEGWTTLEGWFIGLTSDSENPDAAWAFLMHALDKDGVRDYVAAGGPPPGRSSFAEDPEFLAANPYWPTLLDGVATGRSHPKIPEYPEIQSIMAQALNTMATESSPDVAARLAELKPQLEAAVEGSVACP